MLEELKKIVKQTEAANVPARFLFGEVKKLSPLTVLVDNRFYLSPPALVVLKEMYGHTVAMVGSTFTLTVRVMLKVKQNYDDVETLLNRIVPENLVLDLSPMYNQHQTLAAFTHAQLAAYTHYFLRNEVRPHGNN